jgi:hypothetical protein
MTENVSSAARKTRTFRLRTLLAAVTLFACVFTVWSYFAPRNNRLHFPRNTPIELQQAVIDACNTPAEWRASRPGWANAEYTEPMTRIAAFKDQAVLVLIANIDHPAIKLQVIQLLGDLRATQAVPLLLDRLEMDDSANDWFIIAKLAEITNHPKGYGYYRRWFDKKVQDKAVAEYRQWWEQNKKNPGRRAN